MLLPYTIKICRDEYNLKIVLLFFALPLNVQPLGHSLVVNPQLRAGLDRVSTARTSLRRTSDQRTHLTATLNPLVWGAMLERRTRQANKQG